MSLMKVFMDALLVRSSNAFNTSILHQESVCRKPGFRNRKFDPRKDVHEPRRGTAGSIPNGDNYGAAVPRVISIDTTNRAADGGFDP